MVENTKTPQRKGDTKTPTFDKVMFRYSQYGTHSLTLSITISIFPLDNIFQIWWSRIDGRTTFRSFRFF